MSAIRTWPDKNFGNIPEIDKFIRKGPSNNPKARWFVNEQPFANLTLARKCVVQEKQLKVNVPHHMIPYEVVTHSTTSTKQGKRVKQEPICAGGKVDLEVMSTKYGYRVHIPMSRFNVNINLKEFEDVVAFVNALHIKKG